MACLVLLACMVAVGGYTRLSGSGLSITEWKPLHGIIPPLSEQEWQQEYWGYKVSPQGKLVNFDVTMEEFKAIFWPEYWHRVLGRLIGFVFIVPLLFFAIRKSISKPFALRLAAIFALGGLQGLAGWLMVKSGLVDDPMVSHIRLAIHLGLGFTIFALIWWALLQVNNPAIHVAHPPTLAMTNSAILWFAFVFAQIFLGAMVAGLQAGLIFNTWPTMNGEWMPHEIFADPKPWYESVVLIQFMHRTTAILVVLGFGLWWFKWRNIINELQLRATCLSIAAFMLVQFSLGVLTLIRHVPINLALAHQMGGLALFAASVVLLYNLQRFKRMP